MIATFALRAIAGPGHVGSLGQEVLEERERDVRGYVLSHVCVVSPLLLA
jgi:hypothetical protein